jgi:hypothetical protein
MPRDKEAKAAWERAHKAERSRARAEQRAGRAVTKPYVPVTREERIAARFAALPVERVTGNVEASVVALAAPASAKPRKRTEEILIDAVAHFGHKDGDMVSRKERNKVLAFSYWNSLYKALPPNQPDFGSSNGFWGIGPTPIAFEKPTDISTELRLEEQAKQAHAEAEWDALEYEGSNRPHWTFQSLLAKAVAELEAELDEEERKAEAQQKGTEAERDRKQRRKAFDAATRKPLKKVKASDDPMEQTKGILGFLRWLLTTEQPASYDKHGKAVQSQKTIARKAVVDEIARLEKLVDKAKN